jgi:hypothetical protein
MDILIFLAVLIWLIPSFIIGAIGNDRTCGFGSAFWMSIFFTPLFGFLYALCHDPNTHVRLNEKLTAMADMIILKDASELLSDGIITQEEHDRIKNSVLRKEEQPQERTAKGGW